MFRPLPSIGLSQNNKADSFASRGGLFQGKQTSNFNFSSKFGEQLPLVEREAPKKAVFEFSNFDESKPVKYDKIVHGKNK